MSGRQKGTARRASSVGVGGAPGSAKRRAKLRRRGGSRAGRTQNTGGSGWQFARRATVHGMFKSYGLADKDIPPLPEAVAAFKDALTEARAAEDHLRTVLTEGGWLND